MWKLLSVCVRRYVADVKKNNILKRYGEAERRKCSRRNVFNVTGREEEERQRGETALDRACDQQRKADS